MRARRRRRAARARCALPSTRRGRASPRSRRSTRRGARGPSPRPARQPHPADAPVLVRLAASAGRRSSGGAVTAPGCSVRGWRWRSANMTNPRDARKTARGRPVRETAACSRGSGSTAAAIAARPPPRIGARTGGSPPRSSPARTGHRSNRIVSAVLAGHGQRADREPPQPRARRPRGRQSRRTRSRSDTRGGSGAASTPARRCPVLPHDPGGAIRHRERARGIRRGGEVPDNPPLVVVALQFVLPGAFPALHADTVHRDLDHGQPVSPPGGQFPEDVGELPPARRRTGWSR